MNARSLRCPAKLNLALSVARPDPALDGLHPIASWMTAITFADDLQLSRANQTVYRIAAHPDPPAPFQVDWPTEHDLAVRAHRLLETYTGQTLGVDLALTKMIPPGSGLGGGSSDAAAVLVGLNQLFELGLPDNALLELGGTLGADVPFFVGVQLGRPASIATGSGTVLAPATTVRDTPIVLLLPPYHCGTADVYRGYDTNPAHTRPELDRVLALAETGDPLQGFNDLQGPALATSRDLQNGFRNLVAVGLTPRITGSGSAIFVPIRHPEHAEENRALAHETTGWPALTVRAKQS